MIATTMPEMTGTYLNYLWLSLAIFLVVCGLIWWGWRNRKRRQSQLSAPAEVPSQVVESTPEAAAEGMVIGTVKGSDYLDRVAVHELGIRTVGRVEFHWDGSEHHSPQEPPRPHGIAVFRSGARNWFIPAQQIQFVGADHGMIGKFTERDGAIIIGWALGQTQVATGFRPRYAAEGRALLEALNRHFPHAPPLGADQPSAHSPDL